MKLPSFIVKEIFSKVVNSTESVKTSNIFLMRGKCPCCGDYKKRMYVKEYSDLYLVYCHNCGLSHKFETFIKKYFPDEVPYLKSFFLESIKDGSIFNDNVHIEDSESIDFIKTDQMLTTYLPKVGFSIIEQQKKENREKYRNFCISYLNKRKIPFEIYKDFWCITKGILGGYIGIPFYDETKNYLVHLQGRLVLPNKKIKQEKYMFIHDEGVDIPKKSVWGQWRVNIDEPVIISEGTLDACAFKNSISTCGATISDFFIKNIKNKYPHRIWAVDSYWIDKEGQKLTKKLLEMNEKCFIIPKQYDNIKDSNDLLCNIFPNEEYISNDFVNEHTYNGKYGLMKLMFKKSA